MSLYEIIERRRRRDGGCKMIEVKKKKKGEKRGKYKIGRALSLSLFVHCQLSALF